MSEEDKVPRRKLEWRDYVALFIALLQTVALPLVVLVLLILLALAPLGLR
ncbi:MAG: hypothetical protein JRN51_10645 [Nitrososphaerota archaeon]|nr:hypothetical protein [Nitrososphaerota archaeon]MDG6977711.1 hypothetical protein [Nitrososphaerota archaeon]MDG6981552.1 hypothetical protein [Nitrososphaerota archaeon]